MPPIRADPHAAARKHGADAKVLRHPLPRSYRAVIGRGEPRILTPCPDLLCSRSRGSFFVSWLCLWPREGSLRLDS